MAEQGMRELQCSDVMTELASFGQSVAMESVLQQARKGSQTSLPIFLFGESGTGKRLLASVIHGQSERCLKRLVELDGRCLAAEPSILSQSESEVEIDLEAGCWRKYSEFAGQGTLYISNVEHLPLMIQRQLLEDMSFQRGADLQTPNQRPRLIISSTSDLSQAVAEGRVLPALYWRLQVIPLAIPPLRHRLDELPGLVMEMLESGTAQFGREGVSIDEDAMEILLSHDWPGNLHELQSCIHRSLFLCDGEVIRVEDLPMEISQRASLGPKQAKPEVAMDFPSLASALVREGLGQLSPQADNAHQHVVDRVEKELIAQVLEACNYVQTKAATRLGINRNTLHKKVKEYGLESLGPGDGNHGG